MNIFPKHLNIMVDMIVVTKNNYGVIKKMSEYKEYLPEKVLLEQAIYTLEKEIQMKKTLIKFSLKLLERFN